KKDVRKIADALLAYIHREVRYTGVEFGDASIVPRTPSETLQRRYGDCKDQALLLVGLLRAAGVAANVAVLRASNTDDIDPTMPGLRRFNHAIVYVPAAALWIDPSNEFARAGELPSWDRNRWALVADAGTRAPVRTPDAPLATNRVVET